MTKPEKKHRIKLKGYNSIVVQHEIDHINGVMFYDRINPKDPFAVKDGMLYFRIRKKTNRSFFVRV